MMKKRKPMKRSMVKFKERKKKLARIKNELNDLTFS
jgi:hypothetical protein